MKKLLLIRCGAPVFLVIFTVVLCRLFPNAQTAPGAGVYLWLPPFYDNYRSEVITMSEEEKFWLPADTSQLKRSYIQSSGNRYDDFSATLIVAGSDRRSLHRPEVCMVGQGWTIENSEVVSLQISSPKKAELEVMDLWLKKDIQDGEGNKTVLRAHYVYWWVGQTVSTPHSSRRILYSALNNVFKNQNDRWAYPSVMCYVDPRREDGRSFARKIAFDFIREAAPQFQKSFGNQRPPGALELKKVQ